MNKASKSVRMAVAGAAIALLALAGRADASRIFISRSPTSPVDEASSQINPTFSVAQNAPVSIYLWWQQSDPNPLVGISIDIVSSNPVVSRVLYSPDNPTVDGATRWSGTPDSGSGAPTFMVDDANSVIFAGTSMGFAGDLDPLYDAATNSYRMSKLTFKGTSAGTTELRIGVGNLGIAFKSQAFDTPINFGWGDAATAGNAKGSTTTLADATVTVVAPDPLHPWRNPLDPLDVDGNGFVGPLDALAIINEINDHGPHTLTVPPPLDGLPPPYLDVDGDDFVKALDALQVINELNGNQSAMVSAGAPLAAMSVPEPGGALLASLGFALSAIGLRHRSRCLRRRTG